MPRKKVHVREHERRKPHQEERINVDDYDRTQEVNPKPPAGAAELAPSDKRYCENCGSEYPIEEMQRFPGGWYCRHCSIDQEVEQVQGIEKELHPTMQFVRMGETEQLERGLLSKFGLEDEYDNFDEVPKEILDKIKCPHCSSRQFSLWGEPESYGMGWIDLDKGHLEEDDHDYLLDIASQGGHPQKLVCDNCSSEFGSLEF